MIYCNYLNFHLRDTLFLRKQNRKSLPSLLLKILYLIHFHRYWQEEGILKYCFIFTHINHHDHQKISQINRYSLYILQMKNWRTKEIFSGLSQPEAISNHREVSEKNMQVAKLMLLFHEKWVFAFWTLCKETGGILKKVIEKNF